MNERSFFSNECLRHVTKVVGVGDVAVACVTNNNRGKGTSSVAAPSRSSRCKLLLPRSIIFKGVPRHIFTHIFDASSRIAYLTNIGLWSFEYLVYYHSQNSFEVWDYVFVSEHDRKRMIKLMLNQGRNIKIKVELDDSGKPKSKLGIEAYMLSFDFMCIANSVELWNLLVGSLRNPNLIVHISFMWNI